MLKKPMSSVSNVSMQLQVDKRGPCEEVTVQKFLDKYALHLAYSGPNSKITMMHQPTMTRMR